MQLYKEGNKVSIEEIQMSLSAVIKYKLSHHNLIK